MIMPSDYGCDLRVLAIVSLCFFVLCVFSSCSTSSNVDKDAGDADQTDTLTDAPYGLCDPTLNIPDGGCPDGQVVCHSGDAVNCIPNDFCATAGFNVVCNGDP